MFCGHFFPRRYFAPRFWAKVGATSGNVLTPTTGSLSLVGNTPSITTILTPTTGVLPLTGNTPSIITILTPSTGTLNLAGNTATLGVPAPTYIGSGTYSRVAANVNLTPGYPSSIQDGDRLELHFAHRNNVNQFLAVYGGLSGWRLVRQQNQSSARSWVYTKRADGTESGSLTITVSGGESSINHNSVIHLFRGADTSTEEAVNGQGGGTGTNPTDVDVTTTGSNRLAINAVFKNNGESILEFTGETGGDWLLKSEGDGVSTNDCRLGLQTAAMPSSGTISGGSCTGTSGLWTNIGYALLPVATGNNILTPTTGSLSLAGNIPGLQAIITPISGGLQLVGGTAALVNLYVTTGGTLSLAGNAASITHGIVPGVGLLSLAGSSPVLTQIISPNVGVLSLVGNTANIGANNILTPTTGNLSLVGCIPTLCDIRTPYTGVFGLIGNVASIAGAPLIPTTGVLQLYGNSATLTIIHAPSTGVLNLTGNTASVTSGIIPVSGILSLNGNTPSLEETLTPISGVFALIGNTPELGTLTLTPVTGILSLYGNSPSLVNFRTPTSGVLGLVGNTAVITSIRITTTGVLSLAGNVAELLVAREPITGLLSLAGNVAGMLNIPPSAPPALKFRAGKGDRWFSPHTGVNFPASPDAFRPSGTSLLRVRKSYTTKHV